MDWDLTMAVYWDDMGDNAQMEMWIEIAADDQATESQLHQQFYAAHCA